MEPGKGLESAGTALSDNWNTKTKEVEKPHDECTILKTNRTFKTNRHSLGAIEGS